MGHPNGFQGTMTALATPFRGGEVDEEALRRLVNDQIAGGVDVLVPCGTTGEGATLSAEESSRVIRAVVEESHGRAPVIAGCGSNSTATTIENCRRAREAGANAALIVTPYYNKPQQDGLFRHFQAIAQNGRLPVVMYNVPSRTSVDLLAETVGRLASVPGIVGIKEASGTITRTIEILEILDGRPFDILAGDDAFTLPVLALGGDGVVSVASNLVPARVSAIVRSFRKGDVAAAGRGQVALQPLVRALFMETNPAPVKAGLQILGKASDEVRLPLVAASEATREKLKAALARLK
jgi:4-hydroxy-tetrahydrodipicolinate synthase